MGLEPFEIEKIYDALLDDEALPIQTDIHGVDLAQQISLAELELEPVIGW